MQTAKAFKIAHRWIGLISGAIVVLVCATGAIFAVFEDVMEYAAGENLYSRESANAHGNKRAGSQRVLDELHATRPKMQIFTIQTYKDISRNYSILAMEDEKLQIVYADAFTGKVVFEHKELSDFFYDIAHIHSGHIWGDWGAWIIKIASLIFCIQVVVGIYLWWPRRNRKFKDAVSFRKTTNKSRKFFDLHTVPTFYLLIPLAIASATAIYMAYPEIKEPVLEMSGGNIHLDDHDLEAPFTEGKKRVSLNEIENKIFREHPEYPTLHVEAPHDDSATHIAVMALHGDGVVGFMHAGPTWYMDLYTGGYAELQGKTDTLEVNNSIFRMMLSIHTGNYLGMTGRFLAFITGLIGTMLPITGFLMYLKRTRSRKQRLEKGRAQEIVTNGSSRAYTAPVVRPKEEIAS